MKTYPPTGFLRIPQTQEGSKKVITSGGFFLTYPDYKYEQPSKSSAFKITNLTYLSDKLLGKHKQNNVVTFQNLQFFEEQISFTNFLGKFDFNQSFKLINFSVPTHFHQNYKICIPNKKLTFLQSQVHSLFPHLDICVLFNFEKPIDTYAFYF